jgi:predicted O-methyltransferase YrrM
MNMANIKHEVKKLVKTLAINPTALKLVAEGGDLYKKEVIKKYKLKNGLPVIDITDMFPGFCETIYPVSCLSGGSTPLDYVLLKCLAKRMPSCRYLEIGTWRGESIANVSPHAFECYSISLSGEDLFDMGYLLKEDFRVLDFFSKDIKNVIHIKRNSLTFDFSILNKKFDLIFIDGDHHKESIESDTRNAFNLLRDDNSVIVWHDYGMTPETVRWETLSGIMDGCPEVYRGMIYHVSNTLCAVFMKGNYKTHDLHFNAVPTQAFEMRICAKEVL